MLRDLEGTPASWQRVMGIGRGKPVRYTDAAGETFLLNFFDERDAVHFLECAELFPDLSAEEMLVAIQQRDGPAYELYLALAEREARPRSTRPNLPVSGTRTAAFLRSQRDWVCSDEFLRSFEWRRVRMVALERDGARCSCCGRTAHDGIVINVDHIKPRQEFPELSLDPDNCQVLCHDCNHGKGNKFKTDWR